MGQAVAFQAVLVGDPDTHAYELLFSFSSNENKRRFLELVKSNEITQTEDDLLLIPEEDEIRDAWPLAMVLPEDVVRHATLIATTLLDESESERPN